MKLKIAVFSETNPYNDYIETIEVPDTVNPDDVISTINSNLKGCHCELVNIIQEKRVVSRC